MEDVWSLCHTGRGPWEQPTKGAKIMLRRRNPAHASLQEAIAYLASACDGAVRRDGHGFSAEHVALGHNLALKRRWTRRDHRRARKIAIRYRRQLTAAGLRVTSIGGEMGRQGRTLSPAQWAPDPTQIHRLRYWNGARWTALVAGQ